MDRAHKRLPNPLLFHNEVGQAKPPSRILPPEEHAFGKEYKKDDFGAAISKFYVKFSNFDLGCSLRK